MVRFQYRAPLAPPHGLKWAHGCSCNIFLTKRAIILLYTNLKKKKSR